MSFSLLKPELSVAKQIGLFLSVTNIEVTCEGKPHRPRESLFLVLFYVFFFLPFFLNRRTSKPKPLEPHPASSRMLSRLILSEIHAWNQTGDIAAAY